MALVMLWVNAILDGRKKLSDVHRRLRPAVKEELIAQGFEEFAKEDGKG